MSRSSLEIEVSQPQERKSSARIRKKSAKSDRGKKPFEDDVVQVNTEDEKQTQVSFSPPSIEIFGETELARCSTHEKIKATDALSNKVIGLYFSAGWCPPCRRFTPVLKDLYYELKKRGWPFEVVFISCDKTEDSMKDYLNDHGGWLYVPFSETVAQDLKTRYDIHLVPRLIIIKESGDIITSTGRKEVQDRGISSYRVWLESAGLNLELLKKLQRLEIIGGPNALQADTQEQSTEAPSVGTQSSKD